MKNSLLTSLFYLHGSTYAIWWQEYGKNPIQGSPHFHSNIHYIGVEQKSHHCIGDCSYREKQDQLKNGKQYSGLCFLNQLKVWDYYFNIMDEPGLVQF